MSDVQSFGLGRSRRPEFAHPELLAEEGLAPHTVAELWLMSSGISPLREVRLAPQERTTAEMGQLRVAERSLRRDEEAVGTYRRRPPPSRKER